MALDGAFLSTIKTELEQYLGSRIDRIHQPSREEIIIVLRWKGGSGRLLLSANADNARIHFTNHPPENPKVPPMFCMLLRKHLGSGKLVAVRQLEMDRVLYLDFETTNELGDTVVMTIAVEIMGRHSNIIVINQEGKILDAIKRVDASMSGVRMILPNLTYTIPPLQNKKNLLTSTNDELIQALNEQPNGELSKMLLRTIQGISPILSREMAFYTTGGTELRRDDLTGQQTARLRQCFDNIRDILTHNRTKFTVLLDQGKPKDFSFLSIAQYGGFLEAKLFDSASSLLDYFYVERDRVARMKQRSHDLLKMLLNTSERISRKLEIQRNELEHSMNRDEYRLFGDLINANLYRIQKGETRVTLENYYDDNKPVTILLDPMLTPAQNAQRYYSDYKKAITAEKMLTGLLEQSEQELVYIDSVFDTVSRTSTDQEIAEIREELMEQGYLKNTRRNAKHAKPLPPLKYQSTDGFTILCGRNNKQNDRLTLKEAKNYDLWCHTKNIPGSHVIILSDGKEIPDSTIEQACILAAYHSKARESRLVPVDYTLVKYVKKPNGAKPGMVIFTNQQTAYVNPSAELEQKLKQ